MPQFAQAPRRNLREDLSVGLSIFFMGLFKKVVVADTCAVYADAGYGMLKAGLPLDAASAWLTVLAYSFQLYYDFSGYSDMAVGLARMFGVQLPVNFHSPYKSASIVEFWRRWHMTLSRFLRDYLYIPLGGNRYGASRRYANLMVVMLLGGLWHGANWTFVAWGGIHGLLLVVNHAWSRLPRLQLATIVAIPSRIGSIVLTFLAVTLAWVPFRADTFRDGARMWRMLLPDWPAFRDSFANLFQMQLIHPQKAWQLAEWFKPKELWPTPLPPDFIATLRPGLFILALVALGTFLLPNTQQLFARFKPVLNMPAAQLEHRLSFTTLDWKVAALLSGMFVACVLTLSRVSPFLYFQF
jgi:hypothetical protein